MRLRFARAVDGCCPECGHRFSWDELRADRTATRFCSSTIRNATSVRFSSRFSRASADPVLARASPDTRGLPRRLIAYWLAACGAAVLVSMAASLAFVWSSGRLPLWLYPNFGVMLLQALLRASVEVVPWIVLVYLFAWPVLTLAAFAIFRVSLGRCAAVRSTSSLRRLRVGRHRLVRAGAGRPVLRDPSIESAVRRQHDSLDAARHGRAARDGDAPAHRRRASTCDFTSRSAWRC